MGKQRPPLPSLKNLNPPILQTKCEARSSTTVGPGCERDVHEPEGAVVVQGSARAAPRGNPTWRSGAGQAGIAAGGAGARTPRSEVRDATVSPGREPIYSRGGASFEASSVSHHSRINALVAQTLDCSSTHQIQLDRSFSGQLPSSTSPLAALEPPGSLSLNLDRTIPSSREFVSADTVSAATVVSDQNGQVTLAHAREAGHAQCGGV